MRSWARASTMRARARGAGLLARAGDVVVAADGALHEGVEVGVAEGGPPLGDGGLGAGARGGAGGGGAGGGELAPGVGGLGFRGRVVGADRAAGEGGRGGEGDDGSRGA